MANESKIPVGSVLVGKYRVVREIGRGGMAAVYKAEQLSIGKRVAVKVLAASTVVIERFFREARAVASVSSPYIVDVYDSGRLDDGRPFIAMEFLQGESLYDRMARVRVIDVETTIRCITHTAKGLMKAHAARIVHRDLKPEDIFLTKNDEGYALLRYDVYNGTSGTVDVTGFEVFGQGSAENRAGAIRIDERTPVDPDKARVTLRSKQRLSVSMVVRDASTVGRQVQLLLTGSSIRPTVRHINLRPKPGEGLITLGLQGIAGAVWLANPMAPSQLGATSTTGLGLRVRYGFNRRWSFEGELAGTRSGDASWNDMNFAGQQGEIARNATLGRLLLGGLLHFGDRYRPLVRAGLGFQGVDHGSRFTPTGELRRPGRVWTSNWPGFGWLGWVSRPSSGRTGQLASEQCLSVWRRASEVRGSKARLRGV